MPHPLFDAFSDGKRKALVLSYDDGPVHDRKLVEIFNRYKLPCTFHLNSGTLGRDGVLSPGEIKELFTGHEVSVHSVTHPHLPHLSNEGIVQEIMDDRRELERLVGYPVRGMSYPGGGYDDRVVSLLPMLGIEYARTVNNQPGFGLPDDFLRWPVTCHHNQAMEFAERFKKIPPRWSTQVFYVWGHSYEFANAKNWDLIERFCEFIANDPAIWYCTHIQLVDYVNATRRMKCSADGTLVHNPNATPVWATVKEQIVKIGPGVTVTVAS